MKQEDKELLLKDLCARLLYGVKCLVNFNDGTQDIMTLETCLPNSFGKWSFYNKKYSACSNNFKPYLHTMSSMTEDELKTYNELIYCEDARYFPPIRCSEVVEWLDKNMFDHRGLIPNGLAIKVMAKITLINNNYGKKNFNWNA